MSYDVVWPRSERRVSLEPLAARLDTLDGKTVVQLWDYLFRGDDVFELLEEGLRERYPDIKFVNWSEFGSTHGEGEHELLDALPERLQELGADAVISGMGC
ncbi:MAG: hypothetical protein HOI95_29440 [Chromatiales bacterium]|jgi:hypothetical protein|nr:hypothetical protein [Chromatiales bacterium]